MHVLIAGCGWLGTALGRELLARGHRVIGVRRSAAGAEEVRRAGIEPLRLDLSEPGSEARLPGDLDAAVACPSADASAPCSYRHAYLEVNRVLIEAARRRPLRALVYTGSTGVFGQRDGGTVDETTPVAPEGPTAEVLVEAERLVLDAAERDGIETRLVRLSGLYGPGRTGVIERVRSGRLALGPGEETWMNWCHRDDAVAVVLAAIERGRRGAIYHATDAHPPTRGEVVRWIAGRLGLVPPRRDGDDAAGPGNRRGANRRVVGERTREELAITLRYPSFREGLEPLLPVP